MRHTKEDVIMDEKKVREAIEIFKGVEDVRGNLPEDGNEVEEAFYTAIEALEKQIPKKPIKDSNNSVRYIPKKPIKGSNNSVRYIPIFRCPNCNGKLSGFGVTRYCYSCGQCIDWSEWSDK